MEIPKSTKAWLLPAYNFNLIRALISLKIEEIPLKTLAENEVLIEVEAASINPSDLAFLQGGYQVVKKLPAVPGFEATGLVIAAGMNQRLLIGKKVSCFSQDEYGGTWAKHLITSADNCIIIDDSLSLYQAATLAINPLTAIGMMEMAETQKPEALLINAAGGVVPALLRLLAEKANLPTINIFRKKAQADALSNSSFHFSLCSADESFEEDLKIILSKYKSICAFDAVGGSQSGLIFNYLPSNSQLIVYGGLSNENIGDIDVLQMIFQNKKIVGFNLNDYIRNGNMDLNRKKVLDLITETKFQSSVQAEFDFEDLVKAIRTYIKNMSAGKVLIKMK